MTNREKYKQAFSVLHASQPILLEETTMEKETRKFKMRPALAAGLAAALLVGCMGVAYAADLGGIQGKVKVWFGGSAVEADVVDNSTDTVGSYEFTMPGPDGEVVTREAGGVAIDDDGTQHPLSAAEVAAEFADEVVKKDDGSIWLYDHDQAFDITGYLAAGQGKLALEVEGKVVYYDFLEPELAEGSAYSRLFVPTGAAEDYIQLG